MTKWVEVQSSAIRKIGYDSNNNKMQIDFKNSNSYYTYSGVPESVFRDFISASSIGSFYNQHIKDRYESY
jgi:hypothetical protein